VTPELSVAVRAGEAAGALLLGHHAAGVLAEWKGAGDPVTVADREAEAVVRVHLQAAFPDDIIVGEEGAQLAEARVRGRRRWYVDPLDGTANFVKRRRRWAVSIGFCGSDDRMAAAAVLAPVAG
jgi:fructose-1,6-bisphosphatase/inositol monophosphatase family enzyme